MLIPTSEVARTEIETALDAASVPHSIRGSGAWTVIDVDGPGSAEGWTWRDESDLLMLLTRWVDGESRTTTAGREVRSRLLWALIASGQAYQARWIPGYRPVECRIFLADRAEVFATVARVEPVIVASRVIEVDAAAVLVDRLYVLGDQ